jgi:hypothetical protein
MPASKQRGKRGEQGGQSAEDRLTKGRVKAEHHVGALDDPNIPDEPGEIRHTLYFVAVMVLAVVLNLVAMLLVSGGR